MVKILTSKFEHKYKATYYNFEDNQGRISIANNPSCRKRSKYIEHVENELIKL